MSETRDYGNVTIDPKIAASLWLQIATKDICDEAKARIECEVREHFVTKYYDELSRLLDAEKTLEATMAAMGNPKIANRKYRREYLTTKQSAYLQHIAKQHLPVILYWIPNVMLLLIALKQISSGSAYDAIFNVWLNLACSWPMQYTLQYFFRGRPQMLVIASTISCAAYAIAAVTLTVMAIPFFSTGEIALGLVTLLGMLASPIHDILLIRKAHRSAQAVDRKCLK